MLRKYDLKAAKLAAIRYLCQLHRNVNNEVLKRLFDDDNDISYQQEIKLLEKYRHTKDFISTRNSLLQEIEHSLYNIHHDLRFIAYILLREQHQNYYWFVNHNNIYCTDDYDLYHFFYVNSDCYISLIDC